MADISSQSLPPVSFANEKKGEHELQHTVSNINGEVEEARPNLLLPGAKHTVRQLLPRHIQLMAISGAIGTGLFVGSGSALARAGPLGLLLGYAVYSLLVWSTFNAMGEMVTWLPVDGSFVVYAHAYLDDAWGFALGWLYTANSSLSAAGEAAAVAAIINFWTDSVNNVILMVGGNPQHDAFGFRYWKNPGLFNEYVGSGNWGHFLGFWSVFVQAAYAFGGPDYIATAAGEVRSPRRVLPTVFSRVIYRLVLFYVLGVLAVGVLVPYNDSDLGANKPGAGASPFVIGATRLGIPVLPHIINAALLTSAWSCGLELYFAATRSLYALAIDGKVPKFFLSTWRGTPIFCVITIWAITLISFMAVSNSSLTVFTWITNIVGSANLVIFCIFHITYIRFRRAQMAQNVTERPWFRRNQYYYSIISLVFYIIIFFTNGWVVFTKGNWAISSFIFAYFPLTMFIVTYAGYKLIMRPVMAPLHEVPLYAGRSMADIDDGYAEPEPNTKWQKVNRWLWG
ncbi:hypothetical protein AOCH_005649 [Aspergillus ochraceoroseus]|uniref:Amino acid permease/ SLC12A domain-containing protein n=1 Tax=Aspergillus ochraceoroseus TaxID=138278 RepID=A0A0F8X767_9EURO|nr:hypothetical protein AOCH_005649 [Aspergillus ochraceoroseus]